MVILIALALLVLLAIAAQFLGADSRVLDERRPGGLWA